MAPTARRVSGATPVVRTVSIPEGIADETAHPVSSRQDLLLVFVPLLSLLGLYLFTTSIAGKDALNLARAWALKTATSQPVSNFLRQLDTERVSALIYLAAPSPRSLAKFRAQEAATGHVTSALHAALTSGSTLGNTSPAVRQASTALLRDAADLPRLHSSIAARA